jgi:hypothetical protein
MESSAGNGTSLPTVELRRRIGTVNEYYLGLAFFLTDLAWTRRPGPKETCQVLANLMDQIDNLTVQLELLRRHADLLWSISFEQIELGPEALA